MKYIFFVFLFLCQPCFANYLIGSGMYDVTGPAAEVVMTGYARLQQKTSGIHTRLRSRAFVFVDEKTQKRVVFVSADLGHIFQAVQQGVIAELKNRYGNLYTDENVMLSAIHTHSGPGGYSHEILFNSCTFGFIPDNYKVIVSGIVESIVRAHNNLEPGEIFINRGEITNASKNRSLKAYENNPESEKAQYDYPFDTRMTLLRFQGVQEEIGTINWFPLHAVSMSNLNQLISADNKGYASYLFEKEKGVDYFQDKNFVAAFAQSNEGDVSPNIGEEPDDQFVFDFKRTKLAALKQYEKAKELYNTAEEKVVGEIDYRQAYIDLSNIKLEKSTNGIERTSAAALGYSFAAGTTDGAGPLPYFFEQGKLTGNPFIDMLTSIVSVPTDELIMLQFPKPIFLALGQAIPMAWTSPIMPIQIFRIGSFVLLGVPAEFTTMAGRRLSQTIKEVFGNGVKDIVIAGLSNSYSGYVTTPEEYDVQNYEGGFTLFGSQTFTAYAQEFKRLAKDLKYNKKSTSLSPPEDQSKYQITLQTGVLFDDVPPGKKFGDVSVQPLKEYKSGESVFVKFWGAHPNNNLRQGDTFLLVEKKEGSNWKKIADDSDWNTIYEWQREGVSYSKITTAWTIPKNVESGEYRIRHFGDYKYGWNGKIYSYEGVSKTFLVRN